MNDNDVTPAEVRLDGNALAGPMSVVFAADLTVATAICAGCAREETLAELPVYGAPMGLIARCPGCDLAMIRYAELSTGLTLEMAGTAALRMDRGATGTPSLTDRRET
jgi:hypothetical protein